jgi:hypothetical protein
MLAEEIIPHLLFRKRHRQTKRKKDRGIIAGVDLALDILKLLTLKLMFN